MLSAASPALNRRGEGSNPSGPTEKKHWSSSGEDTAFVMRRRRFESDPVLFEVLLNLSIFDNLVCIDCAHDVVEAFLLAMQGVSVRFRLGALIQDVGKPGYSACSGSRRSLVRIQPS